MSSKKLTREEMYSIIKAQAKMLVCYRLGKTPPRQTMHILVIYHDKICEICRR